MRKASYGTKYPLCKLSFEQAATVLFARASRQNDGALSIFVTKKLFFGVSNLVFAVKHFLAPWLTDQTQHITSTINALWSFGSVKVSQILH